MLRSSTPTGSVVPDLMRSVCDKEGPKSVIRLQKQKTGAGLERTEAMNGKVTKKRKKQNKAERQTYECLICKKRISSLGNLKIHERIHTGDKPYNCQYCDRRFVQLSQLKQHQRVHTGERPFTCSCGKSFRQLCHLQQHSRCHSGEKPFRCNRCEDGTSFVQLSQLQQHLNRHHSSPELPPTQGPASKMLRDNSDKRFTSITYRPLDICVDDLRDKIKLESDEVKVEPDMF